MNKDEKQEVINLIQQVVANQEKNVKASEILTENQRATVSLIGSIYDSLDSLLNIIKLILFIIGILVWRVFFWNLTDDLLSATVTRWKQLSENYQILILGLIGTFIFTILAQILATMIKDKIDSALGKK